MTKLNTTNTNNTATTSRANENDNQSQIEAKYDFDKAIEAVAEQSQNFETQAIELLIKLADCATHAHHVNAHKAFEKISFVGAKLQRIHSRISPLRNSAGEFQGIFKSKKSLEKAEKSANALVATLSVIQNYNRVFPSQKRDAPSESEKLKRALNALMKCKKALELEDGINEKTITELTALHERLK